ncbi:MAG TPA: hypothetical protein PKD70_15275 [Saprospiraceae bacterium]|nr:hypothetical protein [Saprospiraceae bacterium]HMP15239.1 hypothetical protein [Saprospiraceae bacterium]
MNTFSRLVLTGIVILSINCIAEAQSTPSEADKKLTEILETLKKNNVPVKENNNYFLFRNIKCNTCLDAFKNNYISSKSKSKNFILYYHEIDEKTLSALKERLKDYVAGSNFIQLKNEKFFNILKEILKSEEENYFIPLNYEGKIDFLVKMPAQ